MRGRLTVSEGVFGSGTIAIDEDVENLLLVGIL